MMGIFSHMKLVTIFMSFNISHVVDPSFHSIKTFQPLVVSLLIFYPLFEATKESSYVVSDL